MRSHVIEPISFVASHQFITAFKVLFQRKPLIGHFFIDAKTFHKLKLPMKIVGKNEIK